MSVSMDRIEGERRVETRATGRRVAWALAAWGAGAAAFATLGAMTAMPRPAVAAMIFTPVVLGVLLFRRSLSVRAWAASLDLRIPILFHVIRAPIGALFLWELSRGELPARFALLAGWGDIVSGLGAIVAVLACPPNSAARRWIVLAWNAVALLDIVAVAISAQRELFFGGGFETMRAFMRAPYPMLPAMIVPLVFLTHFLVFWRLRRSAR